MISSFVANPPQTTYGGQVQLSWTVSGPPDVLTLSDDLSGGTSTDVLGQSSIQVSPARRQTFTLAGSNAQGSDSKTVTVVAAGLDVLSGAPADAGSQNGPASVARFYGPAGVAYLARTGLAYVADTTNCVIRSVDHEGTVSTIAGQSGACVADAGAGVAVFNGPRGIAVDVFGALYVADTGNSAIRLIRPDGGVSNLAGQAGVPGTANGSGAGAQFRSPAGVAVDQAGNIYVADTLNNTIRLISSTGSVSTFAGTPGSGGSNDGPTSSAKFRFPSGIAVGLDGTVYVSDTANYTIRAISPLNQVSTLAGTAGMTGYSDGTGGAARFLGPAAIAVAQDGSLYVFDRYLVRHVTAAGVVKTVAGTPGLTGFQEGAFPGQLNDPGFGWPGGMAVTSQGDLLFPSGNALILATAPDAG